MISFGDIVRVSDTVRRLFAAPDGFYLVTDVYLLSADVVHTVRVQGPVEPGCIAPAFAFPVNMESLEVIPRLVPLELRTPAVCDGDHAAPECTSTQCWRKEPQPRTFGELAEALEALNVTLRVHWNSDRAKWTALLEGPSKSFRGYYVSDACDPDLGQAIRGALAGFKP